MEYSIIAVCAAVVAFFVYHTVHAVATRYDNAKKKTEAKELRDGIDKALSGDNPDLRLAAALRHRLRELGEVG